MFLQFGMNIIFGVGKPVFVSEFQKLEISTLFVTSQPPNIAQNSQKTTKSP
jgi:hypothetical protein